MTETERTSALIQHLRRCFYFIHRRADGGRTGQARVLRLVGRHEEMTQRHLQEHLEIGQSSLSDMVKKMEEQDLIQRTACEQDRRQIHIRLTERGYDLWKENEQADIIRNTEYLQVLTPEDQDTLLQLLAKLDARWSEKYPRQSPHCKREETI